MPRTRGTPQGGVVSPILMNLFMHYAFDNWMQRTWPQSPFARYADDAVVHCRSLAQAQAVMRAIASRLEDCGLTMHPEKSKIVYRKDSNRTGTYPNVQFTFLGFTFRPRGALSKYQRRFTGFLPAVSSDALKRMRQHVRSRRIHRRTSATLDELAQQCNTTIQGWWNYYGAFYRAAMHSLFGYIDLRLMRWARRKYRRLRQRKRRSAEWLRTLEETAQATIGTARSTLEEVSASHDDPADHAGLEWASFCFRNVLYSRQVIPITNLAAAAGRPDRLRNAHADHY
ncbi:reverse transcriptase domain-containing protein [Paraburkholderia sp. UCT2]|uniref:reverse transcriptase domain-containing protein n=1 Tax=Paraburkholderia sp. UCT2 TaxID=2615208 RepID=UPI00223AB423|nr:reverse transcriptase domain-containing protein [Paraburkholderia sp. UCT2]